MPTFILIDNNSSKRMEQKTMLQKIEYTMTLVYLAKQFLATHPAYGIIFSHSDIKFF
jgi:hypothetical protein